MASNDELRIIDQRPVLCVYFAAAELPERITRIIHECGIEIRSDLCPESEVDIMLVVLIGCPVENQRQIVGDALAFKDQALSKRTRVVVIDDLQQGDDAIGWGSSQAIDARIFVDALEGTIFDVLNPL